MKGGLVLKPLIRVVICNESAWLQLEPRAGATLAGVRLYQAGSARKYAGRWGALGGELVYREVAARRWCAVSWLRWREGVHGLLVQRNRLPPGGSTPCRHWSCVVRRPVRVGSGPTWGSLSDVGGRRVTDAAEASILRHCPGVYAEEIRIIILMRSKSINERHE
jgi:hypothetical protein